MITVTWDTPYNVNYRFSVYWQCISEYSYCYIVCKLIHIPKSQLHRISTKTDYLMYSLNAFYDHITTFFSNHIVNVAFPLRLHSRLDFLRISIDNIYLPNIKFKYLFKITQQSRDAQNVKS